MVISLISKKTLSISIKRVKTTKINQGIPEIGKHTVCHVKKEIFYFNGGNYHKFNLTTENPQNNRYPLISSLNYTQFEKSESLLCHNHADTLMYVIGENIIRKNLYSLNIAIYEINCEITLGDCILILKEVSKNEYKRPDSKSKLINIFADESSLYIHGTYDFPILWKITLGLTTINQQKHFPRGYDFFTFDPTSDIILARSQDGLIAKYNVNLEFQTKLNYPSDIQYLWKPRENNDKRHTIIPFIFNTVFIGFENRDNTIGTPKAGKIYKYNIQDNIAVLNDTISLNSESQSIILQIITNPPRNLLYVLTTNDKFNEIHITRLFLLDTPNQITYTFRNLNLIPRLSHIQIINNQIYLFLNFREFSEIYGQVRYSETHFINQDTMIIKDRYSHSGLLHMTNGFLFNGKNYYISYGRPSKMISIDGSGTISDLKLNINGDPVINIYNKDSSLYMITGGFNASILYKYSIDSEEIEKALVIPDSSGILSNILEDKGLVYLSIYEKETRLIVIDSSFSISNIEAFDQISYVKSLKLIGNEIIFVGLNGVLKIDKNQFFILNHILLNTLEKGRTIDVAINKMYIGIQSESNIRHSIYVYTYDTFNLLLKIDFPDKTDKMRIGTSAIHDGLLYVSYIHVDGFPLTVEIINIGTSTHLKTITLEPEEYSNFAIFGSEDILYLPVIGSPCSSVIEFKVSVCPSGTYRDIVCFPCSVGQFNSKPDQISCISCPAGSYADATGLSECKQCSKGYYSFPGSIGANSNNTCMGCSPGTYSDVQGFVGTTCKECPPGTYLPSSLSTSLSDCVKCPLGTFSAISGASSSSVCGLCFPGTWNNETGKSSCFQCPPGTSSLKLGNTNINNCIPCSQGTYSTGGRCIPCPKGTWSSITGATSPGQCNICPNGFGTLDVGNTDPSACIGCKIGTVWNNGLCIPCPPGAYLEGSNTICTKCPLGMYGTFEGSISITDCIKCPTGTYAKKPGLESFKECTLCPKGTFNSETGAIDQEACLECPLGTYSDKKGVIIIDECKGCPPGSKGNRTGLVDIKECVICPPGTISKEKGQTECQECKECILHGSSIKRINQAILRQSLITSNPKTELPAPDGIKFGVGFGLIFFIAILLIPAVICFGCLNLSIYKALKKCDFLFTTRHRIATNQAVMKRKTPCGGICTLLSFCVIIGISALVITDFSAYNIVLDESLRLNTGESILVDQKNLFSASIFLYGRHSVCSSENTTIIGFSDKGNLACNQVEESIREGCECKWVCSECSVTGSPVINFNLKGPIFTPLIEYAWNVPHYFPNKRYILNGTIIAPSGSLFTGKEKKTEVEFIMFSSVFNEQPSGFLRIWYDVSRIGDGLEANYGWTTQLRQIIQGEHSPVNNNFRASDMNFVLRSELAESQFIVTEQLRQSFLNFGAQLSATITTIIATFGFLLISFEGCYQACCVKKKNKISVIGEDKKAKDEIPKKKESKAKKFLDETPRNIQQLNSDVSSEDESDIIKRYNINNLDIENDKVLKENEIANCDLIVNQISVIPKKSKVHLVTLEDTTEIDPDSSEETIDNNSDTKSFDCSDPTKTDFKSEFYKIAFFDN